MPLIVSAVVFLAVARLVGRVGLRLRVRPKEAIERVTGTVAAPDETPTHPSLVFRDMVNRLGTMLPVSPKEAGAIQKKLIRAGIKNPNALRLLYGSKILLGVGLPLAVSLLSFTSTTDAGNKVLLILGAAGVGFFGPNEYINRLGQRRQKRIRKALPNALDLLVVCVESGLGLDQAMMQVAKDLEQAHPEISEEYAMVNLELKAGKRRADALRNLAERSSVDDLKKLVAVLIQADRFGTGVAQSLRAHSDFMRVQARQQAEEKAAKLGVKLVFPIFFCILPSLFVVTVGPMAMKIMREVIPMINEM